MALGQIQLKQMNQAQISGFVAQVAATGVVVRPEDTGDFIDTKTLSNTGVILWNRDWALSGLVGEATGTLYTQLHNTGAKIISLSGDFVELKTRYEGEITGVTDISGITGSIDFTGINVAIYESNGLFTFSGNQGVGDVTQAELNSLSGNVVASGGVFKAQDLELSNNVASLSGAVVFSSETGGYLDLASQTALEARDTELSDNLAEVSGQGGWDHTSGTLLWDRDDSLSGSMDETGLDLFNRDVGLSASIADLSGSIGGGDVTQDELDSLSGNVVASGGTFNTSGLDLWNRDLELSSNVATLSGNTVLSSETGGYLDHASGTLLFDRDTELSTNLAAVSGQVGGGGGGGTAPVGSTKTVVRFHATKDYIAPATGWASPFYGTGYEFLRFDDNDGERAIYNGVMPEGVDLNVGLNVTLFWHPDNDSTDDVAWLTEFQKLDSIAADNWGTAITTIDSATGNQEWIHNFTAIHDSSEIGGIETGDAFLLRVTRSGLLGGDTMSEYANLHYIHIESPVSRTITKTFDRFSGPTFTAPVTGFGQLDYVSGVRTLQLHPDSGEAGMYDSVVPENVDLSNGVRVHLHWFPEEDDANDVEFITAFGKRDVIGDDAFGTEITTTATSTGAGRMHRTFIDHSSAQIGGVETGNYYRLKVGRSGTLGGDTMDGNAHVAQIELETR